MKLIPFSSQPSNKTNRTACGTTTRISIVLLNPTFVTRFPITLSIRLLLVGSKSIFSRDLLLPSSESINGCILSFKDMNSELSSLLVIHWANKNWRNLSSFGSMFSTSENFTFKKFLMSSSCMSCALSLSKSSAGAARVVKFLTIDGSTGCGTRAILQFLVVQRDKKIVTLK